MGREWGARGQGVRPLGTEVSRGQETVGVQLTF